MPPKSKSRGSGLRALTPFDPAIRTTGRELYPDERGQIIGLYQGGRSMRYIAENYKIPLSIVEKTLGHTARKPSTSGPASKIEKSTPRKKAAKPSSSVKVTNYTIPGPSKPINCARYAPFGKRKDAPTLVFTHGAGGTLSDGALASFAKGYGSISPVVLYKAHGMVEGRARAMESVAASVADEGTVLALGGRSMGARAACVAGELDGPKVLVSYPLIGEKGDMRDEALVQLAGDVLLISGDRDKMCPRDRLDEVIERMVHARVWRVTVVGANHGMTLHSRTEEGREATGRVAARWMEERDPEERELCLAWSPNGWVEDDWE